MASWGNIRTEKKEHEDNRKRRNEKNTKIIITRRSEKTKFIFYMKTPGRGEFGIVTSRLGTGKSLTFFKSVVAYAGGGGERDFISDEGGAYSQLS